MKRKKNQLKVVCTKAKSYAPIADLNGGNVYPALSGKDEMYLTKSGGWRDYRNAAQWNYDVITHEPTITFSEVPFCNTLELGAHEGFTNINHVYTSCVLIESLPNTIDASIHLSKEFLCAKNPTTIKKWRDLTILLEHKGPSVFFKIAM